MDRQSIKPCRGGIHRWIRFCFHGNAAKLAHKKLWDKLQRELELGAKVNARDGDGYTALHWTSDAGNEEMVKLLIDYGADLNAEKVRAAGWVVTPLNNAMSNNHLSVVNLLLEKGARCAEGEMPKTGGLDNVELVKILLAHGAIPDLHRVENKEIAELLLQHGADVNNRDCKNQTPLHTIEDARVVKSLIAHGADVNAKDSNNNTPLHLAPVSKSRILLSHGADVNAQTRGEGWTPLHLAAMHGSSKLTGILLNHGADKGIKDGIGLTALSWAEGLERSDVVKVLRSQGAVMDWDFIKTLRERVEREEDKLSPMPFIIPVKRCCREMLIIACAVKYVGTEDETMVSVNSMLSYFSCGLIFHRTASWLDQ